MKNKIENVQKQIAEIAHQIVESSTYIPDVRQRLTIAVNLMDMGSFLGSLAGLVSPPPVMGSEPHPSTCPDCD